MLSDLEEKINQVKTKIKTEAADACFLCSNISKTWLIPKLGTMDNVFILVTNGKNYLFGDTRDIKTLRTYGEFVVICIQTYEDVIAIVKKEKICTLLVEGDITMFEYEKYVKTLKIANIITIDTKKIRAIKTSNEIKILQKSANIICETIDYIKKNIKVGMSEKTVADMIKLHVIQEGASDISFSSIVSFGKNTADIHHFPSATCKLKQHDVIMLDIGCIYQGYCSDITRCFWLSKPDTAALEIYNLVLAAQKKAIAAIKPGVKACEIDAICRNHFTSIAPQWAKTFMHSTGHGVGVQIHELPMVSTKSNDTLVCGQVHTVEPGIYVENLCGVRIEDMVVVTEHGCTVLTKKASK